MSTLFKSRYSFSMKLLWNGFWPTLYHFVSISYTCYIWYKYQWRVDEEMWTLCITLCHFASIPGGTPSHRYRYLHSTSTLVHQFSPQILQLFLVKYKRRCRWKRSMFQFHLSFFQQGHRHRYQSMSNECTANFSRKKWEKKNVDGAKGPGDKAKLYNCSAFTWLLHLTSENAWT